MDIVKCKKCVGMWICDICYNNNKTMYDKTIISYDIGKVNLNYCIVKVYLNSFYILHWETKNIKSKTYENTIDLLCLLLRQINEYVTNNTYILIENQPMLSGNRSIQASIYMYYKISNISVIFIKPINKKLCNFIPADIKIRSNNNKKIAVYYIISICPDKYIEYFKNVNKKDDYADSLIAIIHHISKT